MAQAGYPGYNRANHHNNHNGQHGQIGHNTPPQYPVYQGGIPPYVGSGTMQYASGHAVQPLSGPAPMINQTVPPFQVQQGYSQPPGYPPGQSGHPGGTYPVPAYAMLPPGMPGGPGAPMPPMGYSPPTPLGVEHSGYPNPPVAYGYLPQSHPTQTPQQQYSPQPQHYSPNMPYAPLPAPMAVPPGGPYNQSLSAGPEPHGTLQYSPLSQHATTPPPYSQAIGQQYQTFDQKPHLPSQQAYSSYAPPPIPASTPPTANHSPPISHASPLQVGAPPPALGYNASTIQQAPSAPAAPFEPSAPPVGSIPVTLPAPLSAVQSSASLPADPRTSPSITSGADAAKDVEALFNALTIPINEGMLIAILGSRSMQQMRSITSLYKSTYNVDLAQQLSDVTNGSFGKLCVNLTKPPSQVDAEYVQLAMQGINSDKDLLAEVLCMRTNGQLMVIKQAYLQLYGRELETVLKKELNGHMERLFVGMIRGTRDEVGQYVNVEDDADILMNALKGKPFTSGADRKPSNQAEQFIDFLNNRSYLQIQAVFRAIAQKEAKPMSKIIKDRFKGSLEKVLLSIEYAVNDFPGYLATRFEECMVGTGLRDEVIIRVLSRCRDPELLSKLKDTYSCIYGKTLRERIESKASGEFKRLAALLVS